MTEEEMVWDLSQLVENADPALVQGELRLMVEEAEKIRDMFHGKIENLDANGLLQFLELRDAYTLKFDGVRLYCFLKYSADSTDKVAKQLNDAVRAAMTKVGQALAFVLIELGRLLVKSPSLVSDSALAEYKHFLEKILRRTPYMLSETEERLTIIKDKNGISSWQKLQSDWLSTRTFSFEVGGTARILPYGEIIGFYQNPDRDLRKRAYQTVHQNLGKDDIVWASAIRAVCEDHLQMCRLRKYPSPMTQSFISNDVDQETIDCLLATVKKNVGLHQKYLTLKAKLMGLDKLANYDLTAPLPNASKTTYVWSQARREVADAYHGFDSEVGNWVDEMFERRHIDGKVRKGKASGAFCASWLAEKSAYVLQSFNGNMGDVFTQAHELGHAVHAYLGARAQKPANFETGSCLAETGSVFGELLLTERLLHKAETKTEKQAILANVLDRFFVVTFQVSARAFFEQSLYDALSRGQAFDGDSIASLWVAARDSLYSGSVDWLDEMKWAWVVSPHYFRANYRFYNYPYVYAQLFVYALYQLYKEQAESFVPKLKRLLAARGSKSPRELAAELGFDITQEEFWQKGMKQAEQFVNMLEATLTE
ncbi:MAG TPA: M3 family oligoendopeptidase [Candidatus Bathyarchaeia archaeon]|nr:M3 family oligoendopeptidase [Candidatus Bathyarchaeia archaeon]